MNTILLIEAVYRYYESRRRQFKDLAECRADAVKMNGKKSKKKRLQKTVGCFFECFMSYDKEFYMHIILVVRTKEISLRR